MAFFSIKVLDAKGNTKFVECAENMARIVATSEYQEGDRIMVESSEKNIHVWLQLDDALGANLVYLTGDIFYTIPFGEKKNNMSPKAFSGNVHYLYVRTALEEEVHAYRNQALNVCDQHSIQNMYPHASANVETRGETVFVAPNAIDGCCANDSHGRWPYQSWGINRQPDAALKIDFGREIETDRAVIFTRADFPHDNWWTQVTLTFSDGSSLDWALEKSRFSQEITYEKKKITWVEISKLIKADDPSPFPALTQLEIYGTVVK